jgi:hypothetical protein
MAALDCDFKVPDCSTIASPFEEQKWSKNRDLMDVTKGSGFDACPRSDLRDIFSRHK